MKVPLLDLAAQHGPLRAEILAAISEVVDSQQFISGPAVAELERRIAATCGCTHAVAVSSGTDALLCTLMALGVGAGDEVVTTPYTFFATAGSIVRLGARPVFVDIEPDTFNIAASAVAGAVTSRTRAILPVHLFGQTADMDPILDVAARRGLAVVEDAAQAIGASCRGRPAGSMGAAGCLSFFPSKNLGGMGDGGCIVTRDPALAERCAMLRVHGARPKYVHRLVGGNFRLDTLQAAVLLVKLRHLDAWSASRRAHAAEYGELLAGCGEVSLPAVREGNVSVFNQYVIRAQRRDALQAFLRNERGVSTEVYYPGCLHVQECLASLGHGAFPVAERAAKEALALPVYPELSEEQIAHVARSVREFYGA